MNDKEIFRIIKEHPALKNNQKLGSEGFTIPKFEDVLVVELSEESSRELGELGIHIVGEFGTGNKFYISREMPRINLKVILNRRHDNKIILGENSRLRGQIDLQGDNNIVVAGSAYADVGIAATCRYHRCGLFLGNGGSSPLNNYWIEGPESSIQVGDDFLFSWGIWLRTADSHGLVDLAAGAIINRPKSIILGPHVWLGQDVMVMPGAQIQEGSIIGARSIVTKIIPKCCVAVGAPARVVRKSVTWSRLVNPDQDSIARLQSQYGLSDG